MHIINKYGKVIFTGQECGSFEEGLCPVKVSGKWGYIDQSGKIVIPCQFDYAREFCDGIASVANGTCAGIINKKGKLIHPFVSKYRNWDDVPRIHDGIIRKWDDDLDKYSYIDIEGNQVFRTDSYSDIDDFYEGYARVENANGEYALLNTSGEIVIPFGKYSYISNVSCGVVEVNNCAFVTPKGKEIIPIGKYDRFYSRQSEACVVYALKGDRFGFVDKRNGKEITQIEFPYSCIDKYSCYSREGMTVIKTNTDTYIYDEEHLKVYKSGKFADIGIYNEGLCAVMSNGKVGFIDREGEIVIPCKFDELIGVSIKFEGGLCDLGDKLIDKTGNVVKDFAGYYASYIGNERWVLTYKGRVHCILIDKYGKTLFKGGDGSMIDTSAKEFPIAVRENLWGFLEENGKFVIPYKFKESYAFHNGFAVIEEPVSSTTRSRSSSTTHKPSPSTTSSSSGGCYIATAVYGSYDCPEVWTLRRYRDDVLDNTWYGRLFIRTYYAISPTLVKWFGATEWFRSLFYNRLSKWVTILNKRGFENTPYKDKY